MVILPSQGVKGAVIKGGGGSILKGRYGKVQFILVLRLKVPAVYIEVKRS